MTETFYGNYRVLGYSEAGNFSNPCLAVDLAMLGVADIDTSHEALVEADVSTYEGMSTIPGDGIELNINGNKVTIDSARIFFDLTQLETDTRSQFSRGEAAIVSVKLHEDDPEGDAMHLILLGGHYMDGDRVTRVVVGDSLLDGVQIQPPEDLAARLERTLAFNGALLLYHVSVDYR